MAHKTHKIALRTNGKHEQWFHSQCGYARFAYNTGLADFKAGLSADVFRSKVDLNNRWNQRKKSYDWAKAQDQRAGLYAMIVNSASAISIETLKVPNMLKNKKLAKALSDSALGGFLAKLKSKAEYLGIPIAQAPEFFASSKTCSTCGHKKEALSLSERKYHCRSCGYTEDRDINAAINLRNVAVGQAET